MEPHLQHPITGARLVLLPLLSVALGSLLSLLLGEGLFRTLGLKGQEAGRIFRISNGANLQFPGRAGHTVIDLYSSNPRGTFPIDLGDEATRRQLIAQKFTRVDEARLTNPYGVAFSYNSLGFRDRDFVAKETGTKRLVFIGDSFTEAQGVVEEASAVRLVESLLRRQEPKLASSRASILRRCRPREPSSRSAIARRRAGWPRLRWWRCSPAAGISPATGPGRCACNQPLLPFPRSSRWRTRSQSRGC